jgi:hypothetical protein
MFKERTLWSSLHPSDVWEACPVVLLGSSTHTNLFYKIPCVNCSFFKSIWHTSREKLGSMQLFYSQVFECACVEIYIHNLVHLYPKHSYSDTFAQVQTRTYHLNLLLQWRLYNWTGWKLPRLMKCFRGWHWMSGSTIPSYTGRNG